MQLDCRVQRVKNSKVELTQAFKIKLLFVGSLCQSVEYSFLSQTFLVDLQAGFRPSSRIQTFKQNIDIQDFRHKLKEKDRVSPTAKVSKSILKPVSNSQRNKNHLTYIIYISQKVFQCYPLLSIICLPLPDSCIALINHFRPLFSTLS